MAEPEVKYWVPETKAGRPTSPGYSIYLSRNPENRRATFNKNLGEALEGYRIRWAMMESGRVGFQLVAGNTKVNGVMVTGRQSLVSPLKQLGVKPGSRLWFEFNEQNLMFEETKRELPYGDYTLED